MSAVKFALGSEKPGPLEYCSTACDFLSSIAIRLGSKIPEHIHKIPEHIHKIPELIHKIPEYIHIIPEHIH